jgi:hypothetical protein
VHAAIRKAIRETEEERTRRAYLEQPDSEAEADDWSSAEAELPMKQYQLWWAALPAPAGRRPVLLLNRNAAYFYLNKFAALLLKFRPAATRAPRQICG